MTLNSKSPSNGEDQPVNDEAPARLEVSRRGFLAVAGASLSATVLPMSLTACNPAANVPAPDFTTTLIRPNDLLSLTLNFFNLTLSTDLAKLQPIDATNTAHISVDFGPQHVLEQAETGDPALQPGVPGANTRLGSLISGHSRLVFVVPAGQSIDYTVDGLLGAFSALEMNVPGNATPADGVAQPVATAHPLALTPRGVSAAAVAPPGVVPGPIFRGPPPLPAPPAELETAIELPTRLILSPNTFGGWAHSKSEVTIGASNRTELWHTRLGVRVGGTVDETDTFASARTVRAVWTRDVGFAAAQSSWAANPSGPFPVVADTTPFNASLLSKNRSDIVTESSNFGTLFHRRSPKAVKANRVMLSALGGWLDARGDFGMKTLTGLELWEHRATLGRDHYVKVVYSGILYPWGHSASLLRITERQLTNGAETLWTHYYIVVRQPIVAYSGASDPSLPPLLRQNPHTQITITTLSTPEIQAPANQNAPDPLPVTLVGTSTPYLFKMVGVDHAGKDIHFDGAAVWLPVENALIVRSTPAAAKSNFAAFAYSTPTHGQRVAFAPDSTDPAIPAGKTTFETHSLTHSGSDSLPGWPDPAKVPFLPLMQSAAVAVESLRGLGNLGQTLDVAYHDTYVQHAFEDIISSGKNPGEVFLQLASAADVKFSQNSAQTGGFLSPDVAVTALSRKLGPVAGAADAFGNAASSITSGNFDPSDFFGAILSSAKIFGVFALDKIIPLGPLEKAPKFITEALNDIETLLNDAKTIKDLIDQVNAGASSLPSTLTTLLSNIQASASGIVTAIAAFDAPTLIADVTSLKTYVDQLPSELDSAVKPPFNAILPATLTKGLRTFASTLSKALAVLNGTVGDILKAYQEAQDLAKNLTVKLDWSTPLKRFSIGSEVPGLFEPLGNKTLFLKVELRLKATGGKPAGADLICGIDPFDINLLGPQTFITVHVKTLQFSLKAGEKADVAAELGHPGLEFKGPLSFVQTLTSIIPLDGFLDPPGLTVDASGITAAFSIPIPSLAIGVFALANISIGASLHIPFVGANPLTVGFNFCTREEPFVLTVMFIGGGGFFGVTFDPNGVQVLEASFEAGAALAVDFGVASGSISAMVGVYFKMEGSAATLTGFFRLRGEVDVLGIITASIELYLELTYESASGKVTGTATLDIDVSIAFFHISVSITCQKRFAGANNDPTFLEMMSPWNAQDTAHLAAPYQGEFASLPVTYDPWAEYLQAFAA